MRLKMDENLGHSISEVCRDARHILRFDLGTLARVEITEKPDGTPSVRLLHSKL